MFWLRYAVVTGVTGVSVLTLTRAHIRNNAEVGVTVVTPTAFEKLKPTLRESS